jgi:predicted transcriptional regulator
MVSDLSVRDMLIQLGLSVLQAEVYLALLEIGQADVEIISMQVGISRSSALCVLLELMDIGLVKGLAIPNFLS